MSTTSDQLLTPAWEEIAPSSPTAAGVTIDLVPKLLGLKQILVPVDFSVVAEKAIEYALPFAEQFGAKLTLAYVVDLTLKPVGYRFEEPEVSAYNATAQQMLDAVVRNCIPTTLPERPATAIRAGIPWLEICNVAKEIEADLIILTTHGYTGLKRVLLGSTAERVVRHAPCPVLVVREKEHEFV